MVRNNASLQMISKDITVSLPVKREALATPSLLTHYREASRAIAANGERAIMYFAIVFGIALHFAWEILTAAVKTNVDPDFGSPGLIAARVGIAFIVGLVAFVGIYQQLQSVPQNVRFFTAVTQGFALDALTSPLGPASTAPDG